MMRPIPISSLSVQALSFRYCTTFYASILRALGNSKTPLLAPDFGCPVRYCAGSGIYHCLSYGHSRSCLCNCDLLRGISRFFVLVLYHQKSAGFCGWKKKTGISIGILAKIQMSIGLPMAFQYSITAIGTVTVQWALNLLGLDCRQQLLQQTNKIEQIVTQAYVALGTAVATYAAQNVGAGKVKRIRQGFHAGCMMGCAYAVVTGLIVAFFGKYLQPICFISDDVETIIGYVDIYLKCVATFFIPLVWVNLYRNGDSGTGLWTASHDSRHRRDGGKNGNCR